jgi:apolipoprotein N-acyltransferase
MWLSPWFELRAALAVVAGVSLVAVDRRLRRADEPASLR